MFSICPKKFSSALNATLACTILSLGVGTAEADDEDIDAVLKTFGKSAITQTSETAKIETVADFISSDTGKRTFLIVDGDDSGKIMPFDVVQKKGDKDTHFVHMGNGDIATVLYVKSSVYRSQQVDSDSGSIAVFEPAEPVFLSSQPSGSTVDSKIKVKVAPVSSPTEVSHQGELRCSYEVLGTFQVVSPAGKFETVCVRTRYRGKIGPADVDDSRYIFYAKKFGPVAIRTFNHVEAMIFYNKVKQKSLLLNSCDLVSNDAAHE